MKINKQISDAVYNRYLELLAQGKFKKGVIQQKLREEFELPKTTAFDHSVGRLKKQSQLDQESIGETVERKQLEAVERKPVREPVKPIAMSMPEKGYESYKDAKNGRYILTSWDIRCGIREDFINCLKTLAKELDAELLITPLWINDLDYMPKIITDNFKVITRNIRFNENLVFHYIPSSVLTQSSLTGFRGAFPDDSVILPGGIRELVSEPSGKFCKHLITTGIIGNIDAKYEQFDEEIHIDDVQSNIFNKRWNNIVNKSKSKPTAIAQLYLKPSALVIDIKDSKTFLTRYITQEQPNVIYDLDKKINSDGTIEKSVPLGLVTGDYHAFDHDPLSHKVNLDMITKLQPEEVVLNDFADMRSACYHELQSPYKFSFAPSMQEEAVITKALLKEITDISKRVVYLISNHDQFIVKYMESDPQYHRLNNNYATMMELQEYRSKTGNDPIIRYLDLDKIDNLYVSPEKEIYNIGDVIVLHGHEGGYGALGTRGLIKRYNKMICGHFHSCEYFRNGCVVGSLANPNMSYSTGYNGIMPASAVIQPDSSIQLLPIIHAQNGKSYWR